MKTTTFDVKGMTCDNCVRHVTEAIRRVRGVTETRVNLAGNAAEVTGEFDPAEVSAAVEEEGYEAAARR